MTIFSTKDCPKFIHTKLYPQRITNKIFKWSTEFYRTFDDIISVKNVLESILTLVTTFLLNFLNDRENFYSRNSTLEFSKTKYARRKGTRMRKVHVKIAWFQSVLCFEGKPTVFKTQLLTLFNMYIKGVHIHTELHIHVYVYLG